MSKLSDRIRKASKPEAAPFGFAAAARRAPSPALLIVVRLPDGDAGNSGDAASAGADVVILSDANKAKDAGEAILGVAPGSADRKSVAALREAGADFVVLTPAAAAEAMLDEKLGYVLELRSSLDDARTRLLGDLNLDAIIVPAPETPLTLERLLDLRRIAGLARAPLLVEADAGADASLLQVYRDSGVAGVVVGASGIGKIGELRDRIASLPARGKMREDHAEALVPAQGGGHDHDDFDDDDD